MADFNVVIEDNVVLPKREANFGERKPGPITAALMRMSEGQGFVLPMKGTDGVKTSKGVLNAEQDSERKARQKQSALSGVGKRLGINVKTRYVAHAPEETADEYIKRKWAELQTPFLVVQHAGPRAVEEATPEETDAANAEDAPEGDAGFDLDDE